VDSRSLRPSPASRRALSAARRSPGRRAPPASSGAPLFFGALGSRAQTPTTPCAAPNQPLLCAQLFYRHAGLPYDARWREFALARDREVRASVLGAVGQIPSIFEFEPPQGGREGFGFGVCYTLRATCNGRRSADPRQICRGSGVYRGVPPLAFRMTARVTASRVTARVTAAPAGRGGGGSARARVRRPAAARGAVRVSARRPTPRVPPSRVRNRNPSPAPPPLPFLCGFRNPCFVRIVTA